MSKCKRDWGRGWQCQWEPNHDGPCGCSPTWWKRIQLWLQRGRS